MASNFWKPTTNFFRGVQTAAPKANPTLRGNSSGGWGDAMRLATQVVPRLANIVDPNTGKPIDIDANALRRGDAAYLQATSYFNKPSPALPNYRPGSLGGGGGGGRGGGGGGGGAAAPVDPTMTQGMFDWLMGQFGGGPQSYTPTTLDLPDYAETFDPTMYTELEGKLGTAAEQDRGSANAAYDALGNFLTTNYQNAFTNPNNTYATAGQAPGTSPAQMAEMAKGQGVDPSVMAAQTQGAAEADAGFANVWKLLAANEDTAQRNRLSRVQTDRGVTGRGIDAAVLGGKAGIGMARNKAEQEMKTRVAQMQAQIAQQEAMANWTAQQEASQFNASNANSFQSQRMQAMLGLVPELVRAGGGITLPGQRPSFHTTPQDPLGWASIKAAQDWDAARGGGGGGGPPPRPTFATTAQDPKGWASIAAAQEWDRQYGGG